jgi:hypothetical protein
MTSLCLMIRDKLLMHLMVVCLHCMGGVIDLTRLSDVSHRIIPSLSLLHTLVQHLKISVTRLVSLSREVGCSVLSKKTTKTNEENKSLQQSDRNIAQISFPLKFPERRKAKAARR